MKFFVVAFLFSVSIVGSNANAAVKVFLRDWEQNSFNSCIFDKTEALVAKFDEKILSFMQYTHSRQTRPLKTISAEFIVQNQSDTKVRVLIVALESMNPKGWDLLVEQNFYLGYATDTPNPLAAVRELNSSETLSVLDFSNCILLN